MHESHPISSPSGPPPQNWGFKLWNKKADIKQAAKIKLIKKFTDDATVHEAFLFINFREYWNPGSLLVGNLKTIIGNIF